MYHLVGMVGGVVFIQGVDRDLFLQHATCRPHATLAFFALSAAVRAVLLVRWERGWSAVGLRSDAEEAVTDWTVGAFGVSVDCSGRFLRTSAPNGWRTVPTAAPNRRTRRKATRRAKRRRGQVTKSVVVVDVASHGQLRKGSKSASVTHGRARQMEDSSSPFGKTN